MFGFLLGIDLQGMSGGPGGEGEDGDDRMAGVPSSPPADEARAEAQTQAKQPEEEEEDVSAFGIDVRSVVFLWQTHGCRPVAPGARCGQMLTSFSPVT